MRKSTLIVTYIDIIREKFILQPSTIVWIQFSTVNVATMKQFPFQKPVNYYETVPFSFQPWFKFIVVFGFMMLAWWLIKNWILFEL